MVAGPLCLRLADVDEPGDAKLVDDNAELVAPGLLLHRHRGVPAGGQLLPVAAQGVPVVAAQADPEARGRMVIPHVAGVVGSHDGVAGVGLQLAVHDLVSVGRILAAEVSVGADVKGAAKHAPVELQSLAGVAVEVEERIQPRRHRLLLQPLDGRAPPGPAPRTRRSYQPAPRPTAAEPLAEARCPRDASAGAAPGRSLSPKRFPGGAETAPAAVR